VYGPAALAALGAVAPGTPAWALFVDGYDPRTKKRAHDSGGGSTCHQCRQKVRATFTACGVCGALRGVFCGDCLWMRYGEHVHQARAHHPGPWACPPCRGLCNCSFHRSAAGLPPTGSLYRAALGAGFASVAHFLVLSRLNPAGRAALADAAGGPRPSEAWLGGGPGGDGSDDEDEVALATAARLWARALDRGALGRGRVPPPQAEGGGAGDGGGGGGGKEEEGA
jgi:hypothetical protein